jgi:hypothetical protein
VTRTAQRNAVLQIEAATVAQLVDVVGEQPAA